MQANIFPNIDGEGSIIVSGNGLRSGSATLKIGSGTDEITYFFDSPQEIIALGRKIVEHGADLLRELAQDAIHSTEAL
jgi:hypothetical protein